MTIRELVTRLVSAYDINARIVANVPEWNENRDIVNEKQIGKVVYLNLGKEVLNGNKLS